MNKKFTRPFFYGFFGAPNFGDELLCRTVVEIFSDGRTARVATRRPDFTRRTLAGTRAGIVRGKFPHPGFWLALPKRLWALSTTSQLVIGGGGLIQDVYSTVGMLGITFDVSRMVSRGRPYVFAGIEIGTISRTVSNELAGFLVSNARVIWCRDSLSATRANELGARGTVIVAPDLAHWLLRRWVKENRPRPESHCIVNPRVASERNPAEFAKLIDGLCAQFDRVTLAAAQPGEERAWMRDLGQTPPNLEVYNSAHWQETLELLGSASTIIAERFHYISAGAHLGLRVVPLLSTHKASELADELGIEASQQISVDEFSAGAVMTALVSAQHVSVSVLDSLAADVQAAANTTLELGSESATYDRAAKTQARKLSRKVLGEGRRWIAGAILRRLKRA